MNIIIFFPHTLVHHLEHLRIFPVSYSSKQDGKSDLFMFLFIVNFSDVASGRFTLTSYYPKVPDPWFQGLLLIRPLFSSLNRS